MTYQIVRYVADYCPIHGGMSGSHAVRLPMTYNSLRLARKLAERLEDQEYRGCGDDTFRVVEYGAPAYSFRGGYGVPVTSDDMPF